MTESIRLRTRISRAVRGPLEAMAMRWLVDGFDKKEEALVNLRVGMTPIEVNQLIGEHLQSSNPFMVARFGMSELNLLRKIKKLGDFTLREKLADMIVTGELPFSLPRHYLNTLSFNSGFFPVNDSTVSAFYHLMLESMPQVDLLASWVPGEGYFDNELSAASVCHLFDIEPYRHASPWTQYLAGRDVLIIHPFADTIRSQYSINRQALFSDRLVLPPFRLHTLKAVQSIAGNRPSRFADWFEALDWMFKQALAISANVVILGCGAYGFPLAARLKAAGRKVIHLGGCTQVLFGIRGARWDADPVISKLYNPFWKRPSASERPPFVEHVEQGCYW